MHPAEVIYQAAGHGAGSHAIPFRVVGFDDGSQVMIIGYYASEKAVVVMVRKSPTDEWRTVHGGK